MRRNPDNVDTMWKMWLDARATMKEEWINNNPRKGSGVGGIPLAPVTPTSKPRESIEKSPPGSKEPFADGEKEVPGPPVVAQTESLPSPASPPLSDTAPRVKGDSTILKPQDFAFLKKNLPFHYRNNDWNLVFSLKQHGNNIESFYERASSSVGSILVIKDKAGAIFGGFATDAWKTKTQYYGSGECFLFTISPDSKVYSWTGNNNFFMLSNEDSLAMGGGGNFGIYLDAELRYDIDFPF